jgi:SecD/SecF fusion protein
MQYPRWKVATFAILILAGFLIAAPNLLSREQLDRLPDWLPKQQVTLGLDLRGGSHLLLEVDSASLFQAREQDLADEVGRALRAEGVPPDAISIDDGRLVVTFGDPDMADDAVRIIRGLPSLLSSGPSGTLASPYTVSRSGGSVSIAPTPAAIAEATQAALEQSLEVVRRRIDETGVAEPTIMQQGADRILIQLPGVQDPRRIKALLGTTARMTFHLLDETLDPARLQGGRPPAGVQILPGETAGELYPVRRRIMLEGDRLVDAGAGFDPQTGAPVVTFRFDSIGATRFADITRENVGRRFAIVLDGKVLSAPVIREPITGGSGQISGSFTVQEAQDLSVMLRAGALPAPLKVIEERTVGPDLGQDAIQMGLYTGLLGFALVVGFMVMLYGAWGMLANMALVLNIVLTFAALSLLGATLTLPGIAGIVLGIGLAVDANVLINERIREETRRGRSAMAALDAGFSRAFATIVDSNLTTLIATVLLFAFGSGPVRGFAVTMALGIGISMFTAVSVVRYVMVTWVRRARPKQLVIRPLFGLKLIPDDTSIGFMRARFAGIAVSLVLSIASIGLFVKPGLNYGVDFVGGILLEVRTDGPADLAGLRGALDGLDLGEVGLQEFGGPSNVLVRVQRQPGDDEAQMAAVERVREAISAVAPGAEFERTEVVGPKVSDELYRAGFLAVAFASLAMLIYIWVRFEWQFAIGAILTLILDVTKAVGFFALTGLDFNLTAVAALLTLIGYSVNDKVVIYDRMRENLRLYKRMPLRELIDMSINQTLARSLYTSATAFLALLPMALAGGSAVSSFAIPMLFGIAVGASSSVFIAAPILLFLGENRLRRQAPEPAEEPGPESQAA